MSGTSDVNDDGLVPLTLEPDKMETQEWGHVLALPFHVDPLVIRITRFQKPHQILRPNPAFTIQDPKHDAAAINALLREHRDPGKAMTQEGVFLVLTRPQQELGREKDRRIHYFRFTVTRKTPALIMETNVYVDWRLETLEGEDVTGAILKQHRPVLLNYRRSARGCPIVFYERGSSPGDPFPDDLNEPREGPTTPPKPQPNPQPPPEGGEQMTNDKKAPPPFRADVVVDAIPAVDEDATDALEMERFVRVYLDSAEQTDNELRKPKPGELVKVGVSQDGAIVEKTLPAVRDARGRVMVKLPIREDPIDVAWIVESPHNRFVPKKGRWPEKTDVNIQPQVESDGSLATDPSGDVFAAENTKDDMPPVDIDMDGPDPSPDPPQREAERADKTRQKPQPQMRVVTPSQVGRAPVTAKPPPPAPAPPVSSKKEGDPPPTPAMGLPLQASLLQASRGAEAAVEETSEGQQPVPVDADPMEGWAFRPETPQPQPPPPPAVQHKEPDMTQQQPPGGAGPIPPARPLAQPPPPPQNVGVMVQAPSIKQFASPYAVVAFVIGLILSAMGVYLWKVTDLQDRVAELQKSESALKTEVAFLKDHQIPDIYQNGCKPLLMASNGKLEQIVDEKTGRPIMIIERDGKKRHVLGKDNAEGYGSCSDTTDVARNACYP